MVVNIQKFTVNGIQQNFLDCKGFAGENVLNGGETFENELEFTFKVTQSEIKSITYRIILFNQDGGYAQSNKFNFTHTVNKNNTSNTKELIGLTEIKNINSLNFIVNDTTTLFTLNVKQILNNSCFFGLEGLIIHLQNNDVWVTFSGPLSGRSVNQIVCTSIDVKSNAQLITASKNPIQDFNKDTDNVDGRVYFKKNGIFVDGYQYGINTPASEEKLGVVKLQQNAVYNEEGTLELPSKTGVAASTQYVIDLLKDSNSLVNQEVLQPADTESYGFVKTYNTFEVAEDGGIIAPEGKGVAASPQLVYNALASAIKYTDDKILPLQEVINNLENPLDINIENDVNEKVSLGHELTFSNDFEQVNNKLYIKWVEII